MIKMKPLLKEGILDGLTANFIIDSGVSESSVKSGTKFLSLPRYSVWGVRSSGNGTPKLMENGNNLSTLLDKHKLTEESVYSIEGTIQETIKKIREGKIKKSING